MKKENMLYKYKPISMKTIDSLVNHYFWLAAPTKLNDPFECFVQNKYDATDEEKIFLCEFERLLTVCNDFGFYSDVLDPVYSTLGMTPNIIASKMNLRDDESINIAKSILENSNGRFSIKESEKKDVLKQLNEDIEKMKNGDKSVGYEQQDSCMRDMFGVMSFTTEYNDMLMWSHYADEHKGICLGYNYNKVNDCYEIQNIENIENYTTNLHPQIIAKEVDYNPEPLFFNPIKVKTDVIEQVLYRKMPCWKYEKEYRIVKKNVKNLKDADFRKMYYRREALSEVVFGCNTSEDDIKLVCEIIKKFYPNKVKFYKSKLNKETLELAEPEPIEPCMLNSNNF